MVQTQFNVTFTYQLCEHDGLQVHAILLMLLSFVHVEHLCIKVPYSIQPNTKFCSDNQYSYCIHNYIVNQLK